MARRRVSYWPKATLRYNDPTSGHVFVIDGDPGKLTVIDPKSDSSIATIDAGSKLETAVAGDNGKLYVNGEEKRRFSASTRRPNARRGETGSGRARTSGDAQLRQFPELRWRRWRTVATSSPLISPNVSPSLSSSSIEEGNYRSNLDAGILDDRYCPEKVGDHQREWENPLMSSRLAGTIIGIFSLWGAYAIGRRRIGDNT
jgi:hypothetical protein